jgi:spore germination cell wall hydrolase CwlJ-like protein
VADQDIHDAHEPLLLHVRVPEYRALLIIGALVVLIAALIGGLVWHNNTKPKRRAPNSLSVSIPLPVVEPLMLKAIAEDEARQINASTPFVVGAVPPARPFLFTGSDADRQMATDCLASAIYYEAGNEAIEGQRAVAQVILNRVRHPAYPRTVCGVVFQGSERRTGCQFTFTCDGAMARVPSPDAWMRMRMRAQEMLGGLVYAPVGLATHYHTDWVIPAWSAKLDKIRAERTHLFFRWSGYWGTPAAFRGRYVGGEPNMPKLALLSSAHGATTSLDGLPEDGTLTNTSSAALPDLKAAADPLQSSFILVVDPAVDSGMLTVMAEKACGTRDYCKVMAWTDRTLAPKAFPVPEDRLATLAFSYLRNKEQGFQKPLWNCAIFPRLDVKQCMRHRLLMDAEPKTPPSKDSKAALAPAEATP